MSSVLILLLTTFTIIFSFPKVTKSEDCRKEFGFEETCPTPDVPQHFTSCCWQNTTLTCCPPQSYMNDSFVMIVSVSVILLCLILSILFVICCFWSPCPLYSVCRMNYTYGDIVAYSKADEALSVPEENVQKNNSYTPLHIKVKAVEEE